ncbi:Glycosyl transferase, family 2 [Arcticibacter svalbardensis MN12-7]|uniref:Glycosyl transferase, family 2 n=1 Tax=Arcticibacter svalbardensis MN12-7 TaxID=1150600 RepID=R9GQ69_9SPHI|nr:glycosyltransferase family 2 protein [Arcticibacter svalbardensis]EOR93987.1 Glycosyl transferase, family 2 [Arcticibacter svalbardensis MN12-7]
MLPLKSYPKISIITPSFNQGKYLEETILSVICQHYPNLEYIIIDGGSTDNSIEIIKKYEKHLSYWVTEPDEGLYNALQKGFERSTGDIMAWINSDDMYHRKCLFTVSAIFNSFPELKWLTGYNTFFNEEGQVFTYDNEPYQQRWSKWRMYALKGKFIQQESVFWKRTLWEKAGAKINVQYTLAADLDLWMRFFRHERLYSCAFMLAGFRFRRENQKSNQQRGEYMEQVEQIVGREKDINKDALNSFMRQLMIIMLRIVPFGKFNERLAYKVLQLPRKIVFSLEKGFILSKR